MKLLSVLAFVTLSTLTIAGEVELKPGTRLTLKTNEELTVSCASATDEKIPKCEVRMGMDGKFLVAYGYEIAVTGLATISEALDIAKKSKDIGLCR